MKPEKSICVVATFVAVVVIGLWLAYRPILRFIGVVDLGGHGDSFGGLNALFSGLAFLGLLAAVYLQRQELKAQREEMKAQREEFSKTAQANTESARSAERQAELLKLSSEIMGLAAILESCSTKIEARRRLGETTTNNRIIAENKDMSSLVKERAALEEEIRVRISTERSKNRIQNEN